jgi:hypothetical protein
MTLPVSRATETAVVGGATIIGLLSGPDAADVFIGAFIGSVIFVISAKDYTLFIRVYPNADLPHRHTVTVRPV